MKNFKFILSLLLVFIFVSTSVFASNNIVVYMDNKEVNVREVPIIMDGQAVYSDMGTPTFIHKDSTLVPLRFVAEYYGSDVDWDQKSKSAIVRHGNKNIVMKIDSDEVLVNGETLVIANNARPKLVRAKGPNASTMVPLRFVSEVLGYEVAYNEDKGVPVINSKGSEEKPEEKPVVKEGISDISLLKGTTNLSRLNVKSSKKMDLSHKKDGNKINLTIKNTGLEDQSLADIKLSGAPIKGVAVKETGKNVDIVVTLSEDYNYDIKTFDGGREFTLSPVGKIGEIKRELVDGKESVVIYKERATKVNRMTLSNPRRFVFDIMDSSLGYDYKELGIKVGSISNVRASQYSPDTSYNVKDRVARVVLDMASDVEESDLKVVETKDRIVITPKRNLAEILKYKLSGKEANLELALNKKTDYKYDYNESKNLVTISLPSANLNMDEGSMKINDALVKTIDLSKTGDQASLKIGLNTKIDLEDLNKGSGTSVRLKLTSKEEVKPEDPELKPNPDPKPSKPVNPGAKTIVLDAGHGGGDPGAVSNGTREKDIALSVTKKLDGILKGKGFNTIMTRDDDTFVSLGGRSKIANDAGADLFVSVHANSFGGSAANGIETLHSGSSDSKALSQSIQDELIKDTGAANRGIKHRPNLAVLRGSKMPSTLVELGFITNPEEVAKLNDDSYQNKLAQAIANGIEQFFAIFD